MKFTVEKFDDGIAHYLDIKILDNETDIYFKDTHAGQYMYFSSYALWRIKTAWVKEFNIIKSENKKVIIIYFVE